MNAQERTALMHAVLDGAATPDETRSLTGILAVDARARCEFEELRRVFDGLKAVPQPYPPEGLVASVLARTPQASGTGRPLSVGSRGMAADITSAHASITGNRASGPARREFGMRSLSRGSRTGELKPGKSLNRRLWIGAGVAAAAAAIVVSSRVIDFPSSGKVTAGAIVPAQRSRVDQPSASDSKVDATTGSGTSALDTAGSAGDNSRGNAPRGSSR